MNIYAAPQARVGDLSPARLWKWVKLLAAPFLAVGMFIGSVAAISLVTSVPPVGSPRFETGAFFIGVATLIALAASAPWWIPIAYIYRERAFAAGALIAVGPAALRLALVGNMPTNPLVLATVVIETAGLVALSALGPLWVAHRLGANNSSKPTPLRGAA